MPFATFMDSFPRLDIPISSDIVTSKAIASDAGLVVFFTFHEDFELPPIRTKVNGARSSRAGLK